MGLIDEIRKSGVTSRITEEILYAEALREVEAGIRRDGLWAKALADSGMNQQEASARYLKLRVQSLRDEIDLSSRRIQTHSSQPLIDRKPNATAIPAEVTNSSWRLGTDGLKLMLFGLALVVGGSVIDQHTNDVLRIILFGVGITSVIGGLASMATGIFKSIQQIIQKSKSR